MIDCHLHTNFCRHASGTLDEYVQAALKKGLSEICFTPHLPFPHPIHGFNRANLRMDLEEIETYLKETERVKKGFDQISILTGIEADYYEGYEDYLADILARYPFDLVLMSVHFVRAWPEGQWVMGFNFPDKPLAKIYREYFQALKRGIQTGLFDAVSHLDVVKQPGHPVLKTNAEEVKEIISLCRQSGMALEINTSGFRKEIGESYPAWDIIDLIIKEGVNLTLGSDAHAPSQVALRFKEIIEMLKTFPRARLVHYNQREPQALG